MYLRIFLYFFLAISVRGHLRFHHQGAQRFIKSICKKHNLLLLGGHGLIYQAVVGGSLCGVEKTEIAIYITKLSN